MINKKKVSLDVDMFKEILQNFPKIPRHEFEDLPLEQNILSFIRDLGHTGDITYLTDVNVDYLHQPWRAFSTVINKCLSGKETRMDKISLSRAQILWGMFYKKNIDYDQSISRRNNMFWHTARDDTMFTSMRCISRHEDTQVYGTILPKELTNEAMLESNAYKTYYAFASGKKTPKPKYIRKKADSNTSPKQKPVQATKGTRIKSKAKVSKSDKKKQPAKKPKAKGLAVLSEVALTEAGYRKKQDTISQFSRKWLSEDEDEDNENDLDDLSNEGDDDNNGDDDDDDANDDDKQEGDDMIDDDEESDSDRTESDRIKIPVLDQSTTEYYEEEEEKIDDEETMDEEEDDEVTKELY
ncbi:hypothetical protein Tco_0555713, partial [Tanacetum coccineum]